MHSSGNLSVEVELENRYFEHFQRKATSGFQGIMDWSVWNHLVLQLTHREPFVRESVVAIGALIRSLESGISSAEFTARDNGAPGVATMHKQFALVRYGRAVKAMQAALTSAEPRQVLVACLLVFCFEILLNNRHGALTHAITGHRILQDWLTKHHKSALLDRDLRSPAPVTVDDELVDAFEHLDLQISTIYDARPIEFHQTVIDQGRYVIEHMPLVFSSLADAQRYLTAVMKQSHHFFATTWQYTEPSKLVADFVTTPPGPLAIVAGVNTNSPSFVVPDFLRIQQKPFAKDVLRWSQAFEPLFQRTQLVEKVGSKNYVTSALLKMHGINTRILLAGVLFTEECLYDVFLPQFKDMIDLITIIATTHHKNTADQKGLGPGGFILGLGITAPLYLLCTRCRDRTIRRKGIKILRGWHAEACWDPLLIAEICEWIMEVEEEDCPEGIIPEKSRAIITRVCEAPDEKNGKHALIQCLKRYGGPDGGPVWKERMVYWIPA